MLSRRQFLGLTGALALTACVGPEPSDPKRRERCAGRLEMTMQETVGGAQLVYEDTGGAQAFPFEAAFHGQVEAWFDTWQAKTGLTATTIRTYGAWIDGGSDCGSSWHHAGRAFDIAGINDGDRVLVSCREDRWKGLSPAEQTSHRRRYWMLAASLHLHFAYVLTHLYDPAHDNHIHIDNGVSGSGMSTFDTGSRVQNQAVQAICRYLWDVPCKITGSWDRQTRRASDAVLERLGTRSRLTRGENWAVFLDGSIAR
ncbi:hypothetical protein [Enemella sp. A6]|uniref:hypothetical protein n=1 Tax=Enemella sp. A6 TaxID=3440152 RepID=UPI003EBE5B3F